MICVSKGIRPKVGVDGFGIVVHCVEQLGSSTFRELSNTMLSDAVLVMSTDAAEGDSLLASVDFIEKIPGFEDTVVSVVVPDGNAMGLSKVFESALSFDGVRGISRALKMHIGKARSVVNKYGSDVIAITSKLSSILSKESR